MSERVVEMRRYADGAVYRFLPASADEDGAARYKRADKDVWILRDRDFGWIVWDATDKSLMGRPWDIAIKDQGATPPECDWVSRKGANSYVYRLAFV
ncbi:hypothetical protein F7D14_18915 [Methylocystis parvus]|uniref:Uncharacterized protein n=1 Tax=Methylocystis parvus TaxID=134 RepID=A0A6B8MBL7_9HYPH|nr:hypothetical protein F7D14_18915 [Methylocystis parvus]